MALSHSPAYRTISATASGPASKEALSAPEPFSGDFTLLQKALWETADCFRNRWVAFSLDSGLEVALSQDAGTQRHTLRVTALKDSVRKADVKRDVERLAMVFPITGWAETREVTKLVIRKFWTEG